LELQNQTAQPSNVKTSTLKQSTPPIVLIEQIDMVQIFQRIARRPYTESILMLYLQSLNKFNIAAQEELSKMIISELINNRSFDTLRRLVSYSMLLESKSVACFLLAHSDVDTAAELYVPSNSRRTIKSWPFSERKMPWSSYVFRGINLSCRRSSPTR